MMEGVADKQAELTRQDFVSDQAVRWCPGCGDYMILANMQKAMTQMGTNKEDFLCVSGIGCSSRITYYLDTYGIHSIHGRALAVATGAKLANPDLNVWVFTGDGDCLAIGGNHFIHSCRRNINLNVVIFNNKVYGMTKGQSSPTTPAGIKTKTAPEGSIENTFNIGELAIGSGATFFARVPDNNHKLLEEVMLEANKHTGISVIEVLQNCVIFTDGIHELITGKETKDDNQVVCKHGEPLLFGKDRLYGLKLDGMKLKKVPYDENDTGFISHDMYDEDSAMHLALAKMEIPDLPVAMGIIRQAEKSNYANVLHQNIKRARELSEFKTVHDLFYSGNTWEV